MRLPRRPRGLSGEDAYLWGEIARLITPLRGRAVQKAKALPSGAPVPPRKTSETQAPDAKAVTGKAVAGKAVATKPVAAKTSLPMPVPAHAPLKAPPKRVVKPTPPPSTVAAAMVVTAPALPGLERKARLALRRGSLKVEARIDLHGMYQAEAHGALVGFLMRCRSAGHAHVLVVTGKGGGAGYDDAFSERGVLRRSVPHWLRSPELRSIVIGFEEAARHHGGAGALYVRLRRR
ncbi:Smr/MutS family protein [Methylobacterium sp. 77]|uniref:Smr/MutS family protein n=1 Tax=Methylobacterium sp. 77 TaxID=1101192 RepID=UPI000373D74F|nr:Smr/MutS family protein [Methylobacterium sp. 77]